MRNIRVFAAVAALGALAACAPQSARQAQTDLATTSQSAAAASAQTYAEREKMAAVAKDIQFDIRNIKEIEAFFDNDDRVVTFE